MACFTFFCFVTSNHSDVLKSTSIFKLFRALKLFESLKSLFKVESVTNISKCYTETNLVSVDKSDCLSKDAQRLGKVSGGGLELGVLQPAVSTCFTFTSLLPKVGYFWISLL